VVVGHYLLHVHIFGCCVGQTGAGHLSRQCHLSSKPRFALFLRRAFGFYPAKPEPRAGAAVRQAGAPVASRAGQLLPLPLKTWSCVRALRRLSLFERSRSWGVPQQVCIPRQAPTATAITALGPSKDQKEGILQPWRQSKSKSDGRSCLVSTFIAGRCE
jgi:hypothetical protein